MQKFDKISEDLFNKLRGKFQTITIGDKDGNVTNDPSVARFFDFSYNTGGNDIGKVSVSISEEEGLTVIYSKDIVEFQDDISKRDWFEFLKELRVFSKKRLLDFSVRDINKSNLNKKDYKFLANRSGDDTMTESKLYGTSRISYQKVGEARIVIKHTENVNQESAIGRTQKIGKIYIESADGERFRYPFKHLSGARAMARHIAEGGNTYDDFGKHIVGLSEEMAKLRKFKSYMGRSTVMAESLAGYMDIVKERITTVKKTIESLQKPAAYKQAFESFNPLVLEDVPSDVAENWIDELTIRQFNEELQDIFPYIYNLVKEGTKAKGLGPNDLLDESDEQLDEEVMDDTFVAKKVKDMGATLDDQRDFIKHLAHVAKELKLGKYVMDNPDFVPDIMMAFKNLDEGEQHGNSKIYDKCRKGWRKKPGATRGSKGSCVKEEDDIERGFEEMMGQFGEERTDEFLPALAVPALITAARVAAPKLAQIGAKILSKGAQGAGAVAKGAGKVAIKNPGTTAVVGGGAYIGKKAGDAIDAVGDMAGDLATSAEDILAKAEGGIEAIQGEISAFLGGGAVKQVAAMAAKYALPALAVVALLYGGKKVIDMLRGKSDEPRTEDIEIDESGLQYYTGVKKHGKEYMKKAAEAGRKGASQEELGRLKDKYSKAEKNNKTKEEFELEQAFEDTMGQFADEVCEDCGNPSWRTLTAEAIEEIEEETNEEKQKGVDGKVCWKGYKRMGTKMKGGKRVDNCVKVKEDDLEEAYINTSKDAVEVLGALRGKGKAIERGQDDDQGNLANQYVSDVWDVYSFIEARTNGFSGLDKGAKAAIDAMMKLRGEAKKLETKPGSGKNARFGNAIVNTLYPVIEYLYTTDFDRNKKEDDTDEGNAYANAVRQAKKDGKKKGDEIDGPDGEKITLEKEQKTPLGEFILSYYDRETGAFPKGETAVLTMVEKDYGEQFIEPAKAFIEQVQALYDDYQMRTQPQQMEVDTEFDRMKELAGLR